MRIAHMDDTGQVALACKLKMSAEDSTLHLARREHAIVIEAELTDCHHFRFLGHLTQEYADLICIGCSIMWMNSHTSKDNARMCLCQRQCRTTGSKITSWINH